MKFQMFSALLLIFLATGCSFFESSTQLVAINVTPRDATVIANGLAYTGSPMFIEAKRSDELMLLIYKPGYESQSYVVGNQLSTTGVLDACGGIFIIPLFALTTNGAWALDETNLHFVLKALPPEEQIGKEKAVAAVMAAMSATAMTNESPATSPAAEPDTQAPQSSVPEDAPHEPAATTAK
ncbi:MAG: hypothetical protein PHI85_00315 [Victivallaceae bacterium]|nr:hypothetical protein [Victivallaceae bacterium]